MGSVVNFVRAKEGGIIGLNKYFKEKESGYAFFPKKSVALFCSPAFLLPQQPFLEGGVDGEVRGLKIILIFTSLSHSSSQRIENAPSASFEDCVSSSKDTYQSSF